MPKDFKRTDRLGDAIMRILAVAVRDQIRDPRVGMVNINEVVVTRDLSLAKVYVTIVDRESQDERKAAVAALNKASGFLRTLLARELDTRITPRLQFIYDETSTRGQALSRLIDQAIAADRANHSDESES
ncbi:30S ribosome-binding factor RbfA [Sessilibacter sp. MAH4]